MSNMRASNIANSMFASLKDESSAPPPQKVAIDKSVSTRGTKTFAAAMRDVRMKAAKESMKATPAISSFGANLDSMRSGGASREPKEIEAWNPREDCRPGTGLKMSPCFMSPERNGLENADPRNIAEKTPAPGFYHSSANKRHEKSKKSPPKETNRVFTNFARNNLDPAAHMYHARLRGWEPPATVPCQLTRKKGKPVEKRKPQGLQKFSPTRRDNHPNSRHAHTANISHGVVCGLTPPSGVQRVSYTIDTDVYHKTVFKSSNFGPPIEEQIGRSKPVEPERSWERGVDGPAAADLPKPRVPGGPTLVRSTGRDANVKLMADLPREPVPDTVYHAPEAWKLNSARTPPRSSCWSRSNDRQDTRCTHRMAVAQLPGDVAALVKCPERDHGDERDFYMEAQRRPRSIADFRYQASREQMFDQSNDDSNNTAQVSPSTALRQHFSSQHRLSDQNEWARQVSPPYKILNGDEKPVPTTPTLTTPIHDLGRTDEDMRRRRLTCGANPVNFSSNTGRVPETPPAVPPPSAYKPNLDAVRNRVKSPTNMEKNPRGPMEWVGPGAGGHLDPYPANYDSIKRKGFTATIRSGKPRDTTIKCDGEGADTAYSPRNIMRITSQANNDFGQVLGRSQKSATRFENAYARSGDFMPKADDGLD